MRGQSTRKNSAESKGKPSGSERNNPGMKDFDSDNLERDKEIENKYTEGDGEPSNNVNMRHQNRNTDKGRDEQGEG